MSADDHALEVVLTWLDVNADELVDQSHGDVAQTQALSEDLSELEARVDRIRDELAIVDSSPIPPTLAALSGLQRPKSTPAAPPEWAALRKQAEQCLESRGIDPATVDIDALLDPDEVARIARRFVGAFTVHTHLDRYDLAIILIAGLTAALVDYLVTGAPTSLEEMRDYNPSKEGLTAFFQKDSLKSDNWLSDISHASFDQQRSATGTALPRFTPNTHRDLSLAHDPLLALVVGVRDVMNGTVTTTNQFGGLTSLAGSQAPVSDPLHAIVIVVAHLLSDAFTPRGLPAPGWTLLNSLPVGSFGANDLSIAQGGVRMYAKGYDCRHFLTMSTSVVAAELVLRAYWSLRCELDEEYAKDVGQEAEIAASERVSDHPRYAALAFGAHALACAANAGKVALGGGSMLLFNYAEWFRFLQVAFQLGQGQAVSPTDVLIRRGLTNVEALANGWPEIDIADPRLPDIASEWSPDVH